MSGYHPRPMLKAFISASSGYRNAYWCVRACRTSACLRRWYRKAEKEKGHLLALGYSLEVVRLYGLHLKNPARETRLQRFQEAFDEYLNGPRQLSLF